MHRPWWWGVTNQGLWLVQLYKPEFQNLKGITGPVDELEEGKEREVGSES